MPYYMHELNPDYNPALGMIQHMTTDELKQVLNNDERLETMVKDLQQVKRNEAEREMLLVSNKSLAEFNLSQEPIISELRANVVEHYKNLTDLKRNVETKKEKLDSIKRQMSLDTTLALLQAASAECEEESEALSEKFLSKELSVDSFLEQYLKKRKTANLRRVKSEKMAELLNRSKTSTSYMGGGPSAASSHPAPQPYRYPGYTPYPLPSQTGMPMPYFR